MKCTEILNISRFIVRMKWEYILDVGVVFSIRKILPRLCWFLYKQNYYNKSHTETGQRWCRYSPVLACRFPSLYRLSLVSSSWRSSQKLRCILHGAPCRLRLDRNDFDFLLSCALDSRHFPPIIGSLRRIHDFVVSSVFRLLLVFLHYEIQCRVWFFSLFVMLRFAS